jgi:hypothetical protein
MKRSYDDYGPDNEVPNHLMRITHALVLALVFQLLCGCGSNADEVSQKRDTMTVTQGKVNLFAISDSVFARYGKVGYEELSKPEKVFVCIWELEGEVNNGGFDQYYFNTSGDHAQHAVESLRAIGADHTASLVDKANHLFGDDGPSQNRDRRQKQLVSLPESAANQFAQFDEEFFKYTDNLEQLLTAYVIKHASFFEHE